MSQTKGVCERCGSEIVLDCCNCNGLRPRDRRLDRRHEAVAEFDEKKPRRNKDPQWKIQRRRSERRR